MGKGGGREGREGEGHYIYTLFQLCSQYRTYISINRTLYTIKMHN